MIFAEIDAAEQTGGGRQPSAEGRCEVGIAEGARGDEAEASVGAQDVDAALNEVEIGVSSAGIAAELAFKGGFARAQPLLANVRRVADHAVETASLKDVREGGAPIKGINGNGRQQIRGGRDEGIASAQVGVEVVQGTVGAGGLEPERKFGDFHGLGTDVHAEEVVGENMAVEVEEFGLPAA